MTSRAVAALTDDDWPLLRELADAGLPGMPVVWDDPAVDWSHFDALVVRSCWDYHRRSGEFTQWLAAVERSGTPLWNPAGVVRWNMHKGYLAELERAGVPVPETVWLPAGQPAHLGEVMARQAWTDVVVKPAVSASADGAFRVTRAGADDAGPRLRDLLALGDVMIQPYMPEVVRDGELSLIFLAGRFSHAVIKRPAPSDFRVQSEHGGSHEPTRVPDALVAEARAITERIPGRWLYARVDVVRQEGRLVLMELECIEPDLFFRHHPPARRLFVRALAGLLPARGRGG